MSLRHSLPSPLQHAIERREAQQQLQLAFDQLTTPLAMVDFDARMLRVNAALCEFLGRPAERIVGASFQEFTHPDYRANDLELLESVLAGRLPVHTRQQRYVHADGRSIWAEVSVSLIKRADGRPSYFMLQIRDISERRGYEEELRQMADQDPLTGLRNRRGFQERLRDHIAHIERYGAIGALLMIDLDNFKHHNDSYGHGAGDELLIAVARRLESRLRASDVVGRHGGDEFVVLLPDATREQAEVVASKLIDQISDTTLLSKLSPGEAIGASIGAVCFQTTGSMTPDTALLYADRAMYQAKHSGRNRYVVYDPDEAAGGTLAELPAL